VPSHLYVQKYDYHPFVDVYVIACNKGIAFDLTLSEIASTAVGYDSGEQKMMIIKIVVITAFVASEQKMYYILAILKMTILRLKRQVCP
jgi:hypothetical protein